MSDREVSALALILQDDAALQRLAEQLRAHADSLSRDPLDATCLSLLKSVEATASRRAARHEARAAGTHFGRQVEAVVRKPSAEGEERLPAAIAAFFPDYFKHTLPAATDDGQEMWVSKVYVTPLPLGAEQSQAASLCIRFHMLRDGGTGAFDLSLQVLRLAGGSTDHGVSSTFALKFALQDAPPTETPVWSLDDSQCSKLNELAALLGLAPPLWSATAMLGLLLAVCSCGQLDELDFFCNLQASIRDAHRAEVLAASGSSL